MITSAALKPVPMTNKGMSGEAGCADGPARWRRGCNRGGAGINSEKTPEASTRCLQLMPWDLIKNPSDVLVTPETVSPQWMASAMQT